MRIIVIVIIGLGLSNCLKKTDKKMVVSQGDSLVVPKADSVKTEDIPYEKLFVLETYLENGAVDTTLVQSVDIDCAVLVYPTKEQIEEMKKEYGEDDFSTVADDANYYQGTAIGLLDSLKIKTVSAERPFIKFSGNQNAWTLNLRRKGLPTWNLIFFNRKKEPKIVSTVGLTVDKINDYFKVGN